LELSSQNHLSHFETQASWKHTIVIGDILAGGQIFRGLMLAHNLRATCYEQMKFMLLLNNDDLRRPTLQKTDPSGGVSIPEALERCCIGWGSKSRP